MSVVAAITVGTALLAPVMVACVNFGMYMERLVERHEKETP